MENEITLRKIELKDNGPLANIIRNSLAEFGANKPGTVFYDDSTDHLFEMFQADGSTYFLAEQDEKVLGGAGIFPSTGLPENTCELVKMYLSPAARGKGLGRLLINKCLEAAKSLGYEQVYLETMPELKKAVGIYELFGFDFLKGPMGNTGHFGCDVWMLRKL